MESSSASIDGLPASMVDPFLVEALQNPRHRLTILRMELDIQKFLQNQEQQLFEFQHFPTSYLRLAAHRVAQHYCLQTMVQDNGMDGQGRILVRKTTVARFPPVFLSQIPANQSAVDKPECVRVAIRPRPSKSPEDAASSSLVTQSLCRSMEKRKEEYERARARIFGSHGSTSSADMSSDYLIEGRYTSANHDGTEQYTVNEVEKNTGGVDGGTTSRVAILRDREKDLSDPDYDRSYGRYVKNLPTNSMNFAPFTLQKIQPPFMQREVGYHVPRNAVSFGYVSPSIAMNGPLCAVGSNQIARTAADAPWIGAAAGMPYAQTAFPAPFWHHQSMGFEYLQYH